MAFYRQSTAYTRAFKMIDSADHFSKKTGLTCTVNLSKAGAAFGAAGGTITEVANGWYKVALSTTDTNTVGDLAFYITATGADDTDFVDQVWVRDLADLAFPATSGRSMVVDASGLVDANTVKLGPTGAGIAQTARDIGTSVLLSSGAGTGQLDFTSGVVKANVTQLLGTTWLTPGTAGTPDVNVKLWNALTTVALPLVPTVAGRALDVSAGGEAGLDWANIGTPSTTVNLSGTTVLTVTNQLTAAAIATGIWQDATANDFTTASSIGKALYIANVAPGAAGGHFIAGTNAATTITTGLTTTFTGNLTGSVASVSGLTASNLDTTVSSRLATSGYTAPLDSAGTRTAVGLASANLDTQLSTIAGYIDTEVGTLVTNVAAIKVQTDKFTFTVTNTADVNIQYVNDVAVNGVGSSGNPWGP